MATDESNDRAVHRNTAVTIVRGGTSADEAGGASSARDAAQPTEREGDGLLAVAVVDGVAELSSAVVLAGTARRLFERNPGGLTHEEAVDALLAEGADSIERAMRDADAFLASLRAAGLLFDDAPGDPGGATPSDDEQASAPGDAARDTPTRASEPACPLEADDLERLAREVLQRGYVLRYRALGRSMRPSIPHGSILEVEARPFDRVRRGDVVLYSVGDTRLVAHRVVGRRADALLVRGDSCARLDTIDARAFLGAVTARVGPDGERRDLTGAFERWSGLAGLQVWRAAAAVASVVLVRPLRASYGRRSLVRRVAFGCAHAAGRVLLRGERVLRRLRRPIEVAASGLLTEAEKDARRRTLYERESVQAFTALDENVRAGLTLIEETLLSRHAIGRLRGYERRRGEGRVLVLGCGPGRECIALARMGFEVTGIDRAEGMLARARELTRAAGVEVRYRLGEATAPAASFDRERFDVVVVFSGLFNMVLPRARRVRLLADARELLVDGGQMLVTFLSGYRAPGAAPAAEGGFWTAVNAEHQNGDAYRRNEAVHVFPAVEDLAAEAEEGGFRVAESFRDQRSYDREHGQVRGYVVLEKDPERSSEPGAEESGRPEPRTEAGGGTLQP